jgi:hypothetical protein
MEAKTSGPGKSAPMPWDHFGQGDEVVTGCPPRVLLVQSNSA